MSSRTEKANWLAFWSIKIRDAYSSLISQMHPDVNFISLGGQATSTRAHSYTYTLLLWSWGQVVCIGRWRQIWCKHSSLGNLVCVPLCWREIGVTCRLLVIRLHKQVPHYFTPKIRHEKEKLYSIADTTL